MLIDILGKKVDTNKVTNPTLKILLESCTKEVEGKFIFLGPRRHKDWTQTSYPGRGSCEHRSHTDISADRDYSEHRDYSDEYSEYRDYGGYN